MNGVGTEKTWPAFVREGYKFDPKVLAADDTISLGCLLNRTLPMRMSHLPSLTGCPRGEGTWGIHLCTKFLIRESGRKK